MKRPVMVRVDINEICEDIRALNITQAQVTHEIQAVRCTFSNAKRHGTMACNTIKKICDTYFKHEPKIYEKWISVHDLSIYEKWLAVQEIASNENDRIAVDYDRMKDKLGSMGLQFTSVCRIFDFNDSYNGKIKQTGMCNIEFLQKFCELTNTSLEEYIVKQEEPQASTTVKDNAPEVDPKINADILEAVESILASTRKSVTGISNLETISNNIDAGIVGVLKELQKMTKQLMLISKALGVEEEKK